MSDAPVPARQRKVMSRLQEIRRDRRALRNALDHFADAAAFVAAWGSEDPDLINLRDQVERPYERIVNDLQELIDLCEAEEADRGLPEPEGSGPDRPGRWRRAALRGHLNHAQSARWQAIALGRQRLAHHYVDLAEHQATDIYARANELLSELPGAVRGLGGWIEGLWPADEEA